MFWSDTLAIPKQNVCTHEIGQRIPVAYLEVIGCLGAALAVLLGGVMDFNTADGFGDSVNFGIRECEGLRGSRGAERTIDRFKQVLPCDVDT